MMEIEGEEKNSLCIFLKYFDMNQKVKIIKNYETLYESDIGHVTCNIMNMAHVKKAYTNNSTIII